VELAFLSVDQARSGRTKVGLPGAEEEPQMTAVTIANLLKRQGKQENQIIRMLFEGESARIGTRGARSVSGRPRSSDSGFQDHAE
jgi:hypothetical protein